jgi:glutamate/tyrosine decarboxylase-like PLP-dependent enzyme
VTRDLLTSWGAYEQLLPHAGEAALSYLRTLPQRHVFPRPEELSGLARFDEPLSVAGRPPAETLDLLAEAGGGATTATAGGRYFGFVVGGALPVAVAASWLAAAWDQVAFNDVTSPVAVELERVAGRWVLELLGLPDDAYVGYVTGAATANFACLAAARSELLARQGHDVEADGLAGAPPLRVIASEEIHVTVLKALSLLGIGTSSIERVPTDAQGRMRPEQLRRLDETCIVVAQAGNVNSGGCDPFTELATRVTEAGAWLHVDGAFGLWALASPQRRRLLTGVERAHSWATDTHKWLNTPYDCGLAICALPEALHRAMAAQAPYLARGVRVAPKDMVPEFSRRARAIEVWAALRVLGRAGVADLVERCCRHAAAFADGLAAAGFEILNDVVLNQVVATIGTDSQLEAIVAAVQASGECWLGTTRWRGRTALRVSVSGWATTEADVRRSLAAIERATSQAVAGGVLPTSRRPGQTDNGREDA